MIDQELLNACVVNPWSVVPRMMLIDSMIEAGWTEFKAMEAFEPPPLSNNLPSTYCSNSFGAGMGCGYGGGGDGTGGGRGIGIGYGGGRGDGDGTGGRGDGNGDGYSNDKGYK